MPGYSISSFVASNLSSSNKRGAIWKTNWLHQQLKQRENSFRMMHEHKTFKSQNNIFNAILKALNEET